MHGTRRKQLHHFADGQAYDRHAARVFRAFHRRVAQDVAAAAPRSGTVLDAGCGTGRVAVQLAELRPDLRVTGMDLSPGMVKTATALADRHGLTDRVTFTVADLSALDHPADSVDVVVSTASMHHWADPAAVIASLDRVLRPDGTLWIYDMRWISAAPARAAAAAHDRTTTRTLVRAGALPLALYQRLALDDTSR
ncbi:class I SAM-dependent methyltransferase [Streptomyces sp. NPDC051940]|uniref:class I SAM-dependent methyltransferase n=1 Tax=Streptomyces sp. NPDC051940 TaxID=3155675 RepID=UPI003430319E